LSARRLFVWSAVLALFLDQLTKLLVQGAYMTGPPETWRGVRLLGEVLSITPVANPDGLFSWSYGPRFMYIVLPLFGIGLVIWFALRNRDRWSSAAYGLILGGAVGNLIDRVRLGWVIDFIDFRLPQFRFRWFTFNLADAFLVVGILLLLARGLFGRKSPAAATAEPDAPPAPDHETGLPRP